MMKNIVQTDSLQTKEYLVKRSPLASGVLQHFTINAKTEIIQQTIL